MRHSIQIAVGLALLCGPIFAAEKKPKAPKLDMAIALNNVLSGDTAVAWPAGDYLRNALSRPGYVIEMYSDAFVVALSREDRPEAMQAAMQCLGNSTSWKDPRLLVALEKILDGTLHSGARHMAVRPVLLHWSSDQQIEFLLKEFGNQAEMGVVKAVSELRPSMRRELHDPRIRPLLLDLLGNAHPFIARAALEMLHETVIDGNHGEIPGIIARIRDREDSSPRKYAIELFTQIQPSTEEDRAIILAGFAAERARGDLEPGILEIIDRLHIHFRTVALRPPPKSSKAKENCSLRMAAQRGMTVRRGGRVQRGSE